MANDKIRTVVRAEWHGHGMGFRDATEAQEWIDTLDAIHEIDPDAAERVAYAGDQWRDMPEVAQLRGM